MQIKIASTPPNRLTHEALVEGFFCQEPLLTPYGRRIDLCLNGFLSRSLGRDGIRGDLMEHVLVAATSPRRLPGILLIGLGDPEELTYDRLYDVGYHASRTLDELQFRDDVIHIPIDERSRLTVAGMTEAFMTGYFDFYARTMDLGCPLPDVVVDEGQMEQALSGLASFQARVSGIIGVEIVSERRTRKGSAARKIS